MFCFVFYLILLIVCLFNYTCSACCPCHCTTYLRPCMVSFANVWPTYGLFLVGSVYTTYLCSLYFAYVLLQLLHPKSNCPRIYIAFPDFCLVFPTFPQSYSSTIQYAHSCYNAARLLYDSLRLLVYSLLAVICLHSYSLR